MSHCDTCRFNKESIYGYPCNQCSQALQWLPMVSGDPFQATIEELQTALMDAVNSPKGVVPDSAYEFYRRML